MDFHLLQSVVDELSCLLTGARVERVYQGLDKGLVLVLRQNKKNHILLLSPDRAFPRMHLLSVKPAASGSPYGFILYLRSHLTGMRLSAISLLNHDRVAELRFIKQDAECRLIFECIGPFVNLVLTDAAYTILSVYSQASPDGQGKRSFLPGHQYVPPEKKPQRPVKSDHAGSSCHTGNAERRGELSANRFAEVHYEKLIHGERVSALRAKISSLVKKALARLIKKTAAIEKDLSSAGKVDEYRQAGELILANLKKLKIGMETAVLIGYDNKETVVKLDAGTSPAKNAEAYFKRYKKSKAGIALIRERLREARDETAFLQLLQAGLERAMDEEGLIKIRSQLAERGHIKHGPRTRANEGPAPVPFRKITYSGWEILVGKSASGNDYITTKLGRPDDLWLHAEGMPGSHVLVRNPERRDVPPDVLKKAASLAAYYSKGKSAGKVPVAYTPAKYVKKPKGAKPGLVILVERKTIMAVPGEE